MKVYVFYRYVEVEGEMPDWTILGVYDTKEKAIAERTKVFLAETNDKDNDAYVDENTQDLNGNIVRIFYGGQDNWTAYIEFIIQEKELE